MLKILQRQNILLLKKLDKNYFKRYFLSNAYKCTEVWENRLKSPVFSKVDFDNLYFDLDLNFQRQNRINVLDIDLLVNSLQSYTFKNELEDILVKLRLCPECVLLPDRAMHAVIRWYMDNGPREDLLSLLGDRLNYGMFLDHYLSNLLMDTYLKDKDAISAVKIAVLQMLQEDFEHPILKTLALYSCYYYLASSETWESIKEPEEDPDEDVQKVRVKYLRNPYFDDHFDIKEPNHLVGKTLYMLGEIIGGTLGTSSKIIGLVLHQKYEKCSGFLEDVIKNNQQVYVDAISKAKELASGSSGESKEESSDVAEGEKTENPEKVEAAPVPDEWKTKVLELLAKVPEKNLVKGDLLASAEELVKKAVAEHEKNDIEMQSQVYKQWEKERDEHIESEIKRSEAEKVKEKIEKIKKELEEEEEKLFYFDREEELEMSFLEKEEKLKSVTYYKGKGKNKEKVEEEYVPPEVDKRKN